MGIVENSELNNQALLTYFQCKQIDFGISILLLREMGSGYLGDKTLA